MDNQSKIGSSVVTVVVAVALAVAASFMVVNKTAPVQDSHVAGSLAGPDINSYVNVNGRFQQGTGCTASSTTAAFGVIQNDDLDSESCLDFTVNVADVALALPATTSPIYPRNAGQWRTIWIRNATSTATADIFVGVGTGVTFKLASTSNAVGTATSTIFGDTDADNTLRIDLLRKTDTDINAYLTSFRD